MMVPPEARDLFTAAHWNDRVLTTVPAPERVVDEVTARTRLLLAREVPLATWTRLAGLPDGATATILPQPGSVTGVRVAAYHPWFDGPAYRVFHRDEHGRLAAVNEYLRLKVDTRDGVGTRMLAHQALQTKQAGFVYIYADAEGSAGGTMNGYYTWARLGFDGSIPAAVRARLPLELSGCHSVLDILEREGGAAWWREHGRTFSGTFDLRDGSRSIAVLQAYTKTRGIRV